jgi:hypothetical protein
MGKSPSSRQQRIRRPLRRAETDGAARRCSGLRSGPILDETREPRARSTATRSANPSSASSTRLPLPCSTAVNHIIVQDDIKDRLIAPGAAPIGGSAQSFWGLIKKDVARWAKTVKASGAKPEYGFTQLPPPASSVLGEGMGAISCWRRTEAGVAYVRGQSTRIEKVT